MDEFILTKFYNEPKEKYNLASVVIFQIASKDNVFDEYYKGLVLLLEKLPEYLPGFYLRLYYDDSITDKNMLRLIEDAKKIDYVQATHFTHPWFLEKDKEVGTHRGLFGTVVRLLPFFDNSNTILTLSVEADVYHRLLMTYERMYKIFRDKTEKIFFITRECYYNRPRYRAVTKTLKNKFVPLMGTFWVRGKLPREIFDDFLNCIRSLDFTNDCEYLGVFAKMRALQYGDEQAPERYIMEYGIDEIFATKIIKYLIDEKIPYLVDLMSDISNIFNQVFQKDKNAKESDLYKKLFQRILGNRYNNNLTPGQNFGIINQAVNYDYSFTPKKGHEKVLIKNTFVELVKLLHNDEYLKYGFDLEDLQCLKKSRDIFHAVVLRCEGYQCNIIQKYDEKEKNKLFVYSPGLEVYIKRSILPKILINPKNYSIKGSFSRKIPYITDIDVNNYANRHDIIKKIHELLDQSDPNIILGCVYCGKDERFILNENDSKDIQRIKSLFDSDNANKIDAILEKYREDESAKKYYLDMFLGNFIRIKWMPKEILADKKFLANNLGLTSCASGTGQNKQSDLLPAEISFAEAIEKTHNIVLYYYIKIGPCMMPFDVTITFNNNNEGSKGKYVNAYVELLMNTSKYSDDYFDKLYSLRNYFKNKNNKQEFMDLEEVIEHKFGLEKQLINRIYVYRSMLHFNYLNEREAINLAKYILLGLSHLKKFQESANEIDAILINNDSNKLEKINQTLTKLCIKLSDFLSESSKTYFFEYLKKMPVEDQKKYYH